MSSRESETECEGKHIALRVNNNPEEPVNKEATTHPRNSVICEVSAKHTCTQGRREGLRRRRREPREMNAKGIHNTNGLHKRMFVTSSAKSNYSMRGSSCLTTRKKRNWTRRVMASVEPSFRVNIMRYFMHDYVHTDTTGEADMLRAWARAIRSC